MRATEKKNKPTDVLSFPQFEFRAPEKIKEDAGVHFLGDIVISTDACRRQAAEIGHSMGDEFLRLFTHGFLHLCGYDHEISAMAERKMFRKEDELLELLDQNEQRKRKRKA
jgi:probable rRNA maturation factor